MRKHPDAGVLHYVFSVSLQSRSTIESEAARLSAALSSKEAAVRASIRRMKAALDAQENKLVAELHAVADRHITSCEARVCSRCFWCASVG